MQKNALGNLIKMQVILNLQVGGMSILNHSQASRWCHAADHWTSLSNKVLNNSTIAHLPPVLGYCLDHARGSERLICVWDQGSNPNIPALSHFAQSTITFTLLCPSSCKVYKALSWAKMYSSVTLVKESVLTLGRGSWMLPGCSDKLFPNICIWWLLTQMSWCLNVMKILIPESLQGAFRREPG